MTDAAAAPHEVTPEDVAWARAIAANYARKVPHMAEEFESAALLGLVEAARSFDPERGMNFRTHAAWRVNGAIKDAARGEEANGYRRSWRARNPGAEVPRTESIHKVTGYRDDGTPVDGSALVASGDLPVGWELEYQDEVAGLSRRLPRDWQAAFRAFFGRGDGATHRRAGALAGVSESRVSQILTASAAYLAERFPDPIEAFMTGRATPDGTDEVDLMPIAPETAAKDPRVRELLRLKGVDVDAIAPMAEPAAPLRPSRRDDPTPEEIEAAKEALRPVKEAELKVGRPGTALGKYDRREKCGRCGRKANSFADHCLHCGEKRPAGAPPEPEPSPRETPLAAAAVRVNESKAAPATAAKTCPRCGGPCSAYNGRCYKCRPGVPKGATLTPAAANGDPGTPPIALRSGPPPAARSVPPMEAPAIVAPMPAPPAAAAAPAPPPPLDPQADPELAAIGAVLRAVAGLDAGAQARVWAYVRSRSRASL